MPRYKIFTKDNLDPTIKVERSYPAFKVIEVDENLAGELAKFYPLQKVPEVAEPEFAAPLSTLATANDDRRGRRDVTVRFKFPVDPETIASVENLGASIIGHTGNSGLVATVPNKRVLSALKKNEHVAGVTLHRASIDIDPSFFQQLIEQHVPDTLEAAFETQEATPKRAPTRNLSVPGVLVVEFYTDEDTERGLRRLKREKAGAVDRIADTRLMVDLTGSEDIESDALAIFKCVGLKRVSEKKVKQLYNDRARHVIGDGIVTQPPHNNRLTGNGEIVGVADSGLDTGVAATIHPDFRGRVAHIESWPIAPSFSPFVLNDGADDGASDDFSGHGTHVAGSVLGDGSRSISLGLPPIEGVAPAAQLVFQAIEQRPQWTQAQKIQFLISGQKPPASGLYGIPDDLQDLFRSAYTAGARIHNNSWGGGVPGAYDEQCDDLDRFVWDNKDFLVVVAAGNSGTDQHVPHGHIDPTSVDSPATAKNCLTVGACENVRSDSFSIKYSDWWSDDFAHPGISQDPMADSNDDVVAFSSRGPTNTGRRKPDVVAPGTFILSTRSSTMPANNFAWGAFNSAKSDYMYMGGTSMASPLAAGAAALLRQHLRKNSGIDTPSAALLKAGMIHSAQYLNYRFAAPDALAPADNEQGWGQVTLANVIDLEQPEMVFYHDDTGGLQTGQDRTFIVSLSSQSDLRITLVYTDFPGEQLINNLNLLVFDPNGVAHLGNDFSNTGALDDLNNVEGILVANAIAGEWTVSVVASDVTVGPQDFALVITAGNDFSAA
ncbi:hypothetical protein IWQ48_001302 [Labrenzia sp. EL_13]|nr:hypothetical protein [Labrenzia sp. EL_13]